MYKLMSHLVLILSTSRLEIDYFTHKSINKKKKVNNDNKLISGGKQTQKVVLNHIISPHELAYVPLFHFYRFFECIHIEKQKVNLPM